MPDKSVAEKLLIKDNYKVLLVNEPKDYRRTLGKLPAGVIVSNEASGSFDLAQVFVSSRKELEANLKKLKPVLKPAGLLWVTYPKGTSKVKVDINRDSIREYAESNGFKAVAMIAVDDTWSALRLKVV
ncbi:MAG: DUF3052 family protein [Chloroflexi bacterium]|nr:DUF3052 family protein [Chloroflexota bacterium]